MQNTPNDNKETPNSDRATYGPARNRKCCVCFRAVLGSVHLLKLYQSVIVFINFLSAAFVASELFEL
jgi:hypothetical protein